MWCTWGVPLTALGFVPQAGAVVGHGHVADLPEQACPLPEEAPGSAPRRSVGDVQTPAGTGWPGWDLHPVIPESVTPRD